MGGWGSRRVEETGGTVNSTFENFSLHGPPTPMSLLLTPTFRRRSPTILSADIRADGVKGVCPSGTSPVTSGREKMVMNINQDKRRSQIYLPN